MSLFQCPALFIAAPASGQGKTTVTAALARLHRNAGYRVRVFKTGPDFLDPLILERASGAPVYQLDLFMGGEAHCRSLLYAAAKEADLILVEGVMGLFDGDPSGADLAQIFGLPVLAVINATAMAQTFAALAFGLAHFRPQLTFAGVIANQVSSESHLNLLRNSLPAEIHWYGALPKESPVLPSRHLGLMMADEIVNLDDRIDELADLLSRSSSFELPPPVNFYPANESPAPKPILQGKIVAVARDAAFSFIYHVNLDCLKRLGAELVFFSPIAGDVLPHCDSLYLPGGYPELHLDSLANNSSLIQSLIDHVQTGKPILAECGGMLFLLESLTDASGKCAKMAAVLPGKARLLQRLANLGLHSVALPEGELRGHTFHHSVTETTLSPVAFSAGKRGKPEPVYQIERTYATYMHLYFPSNQDAIGKIFSP